MNEQKPTIEEMENYLEIWKGTLTLLGEWELGDEWVRRAIRSAIRPAWISVKDRLPEKDGWYLIFAGGVTVEYYAERGWDCHGVTHWQPLPPGPVDEKKEG